MPTARNFARRAYQCGLHEAQDVLLEIDDVDLICLEPSRGFVFREMLQRKIAFRDLSKRLVFLNPGLQKFRLTQEYDLFVASCQSFGDLLYLNAIEGWKDRCKTSVCWLDEMWVAELPRWRHWLHALKQFDHIFVGCRRTIAPLSEAIGRTCHWFPGAVDALRFSPYPNPPLRMIDVYSIGRRWDGIHQSLLRAAARKEIFYVYDTFPAMANLEPYNPQQHRDFYANMAKRARCFMVAPGKMNLPGETQEQVEVSYRYFEGAATGAVLIGQQPVCEAFRETFPWPDAVIPIQPDGADILDVLADLGSDPARLSAISQRNAVKALLHHDWVYRWKEIFRVAGIEPSPGLVARERHLKDLATLALSSSQTEVMTTLQGEKEPE